MIKRKVYEIILNKEREPFLEPIKGNLKTRRIFLGDYPIILYFSDQEPERLLYRDQILFSDSLTYPSENSIIKKKYDAVKEFQNDMTYIAKGYENKGILVNVHIGSTLQDLINFLPAQVLELVTDSTAPFLIGKIGECEIFVDPFMKYTDHRIFDLEKNLIVDLGIKYKELL